MSVRKIYLLLAILTVALLTGCGDDGELLEYRKEVEEFYAELEERDQAINAISTDTQAASAELLEELDKVNVAFQEFAALEVPRQYASVESLADEAAELMDEAVSQYHVAFSGETINELDASLAYEKYSRAIHRINLIGDLFQGKDLEGEGITVIYEDDPEE